MGTTDFSNLKADDLVIITKSFYPGELARVTKVTENFFNVRSLKYNKRTGAETGIKNGYSKSYAAIPTDQEIIQIRDRKKKLEIINSLKTVIWSRFSLGALERIHDLVINTTPPYDK